MSSEEKKRVAVEGEFVDLNRFRGLGEDVVYHAPVLATQRFWPLDEWSTAPRELGYDDMPAVAWKGLRLLKDPDTQAVYHNLLWELKPRTVVEVGVYGGGSLVWFRDLARAFGFPCRVIGLDNDLSRCQIKESEMEDILLHSADCNRPESLVEALVGAEHPILFIDDAHCNTFNMLREAVNNVLVGGDYIVLEDMMGLWKRYSPNILASHLAAFKHVMRLDLLYSNVPCQLRDGVFKVMQLDE